MSLRPGKKGASRPRSDTAVPVSDDVSDDEALAHKLKGLQNALDSGVITQEEFDKKRQQILDSY